MNNYNHVRHTQPSQVRLLPVHHGYPATKHGHQGTINLWRLIQEDPGVKGSCWFAKHREDPGHIVANIIRIIVLLIISPLYIMVLDIILLRSEQAKGMKKSWFYERSLPSSAVLRYPPGAEDNRVSEYEPTDFLPQWLLKVTIEGDTFKSMEQISYGEALKIQDFWKQGYTALSYSMESAEWLFKLARGKLEDPTNPENRKYSLRDRRSIAKKYLEEYCRAKASDRPPNRTEFIWLDEFCLSDDKAIEQETDEERKKQLQKAQRSEELGRLADIFRGAQSVCVFCHDVECPHTTQNCCWGQRLFTLAEIMHAKRVDVMITKTETTQSSEISYIFYISSMDGHVFRRQMLQSASLSGKWHLWAIMQSTLNSGSVPWQVAIHSLVVEAIIRNNVSGYAEHKMLGKGLNGLLPRRAKLEDLKGKNGWADLAWLLELNQGFYNAVSLAAVCTLGSDGAWIGPPIEPSAGNERLEPLATAFPVGTIGSGDVIPALSILGAEGIKVRHDFKRDPLALWHQKDWNRVSNSTRFAAFICMFFAFFIAAFSGPTNLIVKIIMIPWSFAAVFMVFQLIVGTMYLEDGWVFLEDTGYEDAASMLTKQDYRLARRGIPDQWGKEQLIPRWDCRLKDSRRGVIVDVRTGIMTEVTVAGKPNALVVLAIHGNGVTCMLIDRPADDSESVTKKVGMCSLPPYMLHMTAKGGSVSVGGNVQSQKSTQEKGI